MGHVQKLMEIVYIQIHTHIQYKSDIKNNIKTIDKQYKNYREII